MKMPSPQEMKDYLLNCGKRYWPQNQDKLKSLPIPLIGIPSDLKAPFEYSMVKLPDWAADLGVEGSLLVPKFCLGSGKGFESVDWWSACFVMLSGWEEVRYEMGHGPVHSYSFPLVREGMDARVFERAWVNRIFLFLRRWTARRDETSDEQLFGPLPEAEILLTHDVDAVRKTLSIRLKQSAFQLINVVRLLMQGRLQQIPEKIRAAFRFLLLPTNYDRIPEMVRLEKEYGVRGEYNFYAGRGGWLRPFRDLFFDPGYKISKVFPSLAASLAENQSRIGLHPTFASWKNPGHLKDEKQRLEAATRFPVDLCRQHWLRFSWLSTWRAQEEAGFKRDSTLGFNDRSGFRNGAALEFSPWNFESNRAAQIRALPLVLMDSHLYDYSFLSAEQQRERITHWIQEVRSVHGQATVLWHPHTLSPDYGWKSGFLELLKVLRTSSIE